jgi:ABC-type branched-subunit amino acid transport system ATPase component
MAGASVPRQILAFPGEPAQIGRATVDAMELTGTTPIGPRTVSDISTGERRLVELGRALAGPFDLLMLDEPSSGLDSTQTERFGDLLRDAVNKRGIGILLVEHDMSLVTQVCDYIYVVDFGTLIYEGTPDDVMASEAVRDAYLGTEIVATEPAPAGATPDQVTS